MLRRLSSYRRTLRGLALAAVVLVCGGQVLAGQHLHETPAPEEICALCGYLESGLATLQAGAANQADSWPATVHAEAPGAPLVFRHFEILPPRAPPTA